MSQCLHAIFIKGKNFSIFFDASLETESLQNIFCQNMAYSYIGKKFAPVLFFQDLTRTKMRDDDLSVRSLS